MSMPLSVHQRRTTFSLQHLEVWRDPKQKTNNLKCLHFDFSTSQLHYCVKLHVQHCTKWFTLFWPFLIPLLH